MQQSIQEQTKPVHVAEIEIKPTWKLAWGLSWRMVLIWLAIELVIAIPVFIIAAMFQFGL